MNIEEYYKYMSQIDNAPKNTFPSENKKSIKCAYNKDIEAHCYNCPFVNIHPLCKEVSKRAMQNIQFYDCDTLLGLSNEEIYKPDYIFIDE